MRLFAALIVTLSLITSCAAAPASRSTASTIPDEGPFLVHALHTYATQYWARVAGRDTGLAPRTNGHDEFAARWTRDMQSALHGLHAAVFRQSFFTPGFRTLPATRPGVNIMVVVPGSRRPQEAVIVGAHYDGEPSSKGSAFDDASGSLVTLALARALGETWRSEGRPARTVEFILFDGEEQGLTGSLALTFIERHGAVMPRPVLMIDEEQSGVGYPVRPFGLRSQPIEPSFAVTVDHLPAFFGTSKRMDPAAASQLLARTRAARSEVFSQLRARYSPLPYRGGQAAAFAAQDEKLLEIGPGSICCSDNDPYQKMGIPNLTLAGNTSFYDRGAQPWAYPFDQPWDTFSALACDTGGDPKPSRALEAALDLPMAISDAVIHAYAPPARGEGMALLSMLAVRGKSVRFIAVGAGPARWDFGDGGAATGAKVSHIYRRTGSYRVTVHSGALTAAGQVRVLAKRLQPKLVFGVVNPPSVRPWRPAALQHVPACRPVLSTSG